MLRTAIVASAIVAQAVASSTVSLTGGLSGRVIDAQGGLIPGATVSIRTAGQSSPRHVVTGVDGAYRFEAVRPGIYELNVALPGFASTRRDNVVVAAAMSLQPDMRLMARATCECVITPASEKAARLRDLRVIRGLVSRQ